MEPMKPNALRPVLAGTLTGIVLTTIPPCCCLNCFCCLNFIIAGAVAGALYGRAAARIGWYAALGEGALAGLLAGLLSGIVHGALGGLLLALGGLPNLHELVGPGGPVTVGLGGLGAAVQSELEWPLPGPIPDFLGRASGAGAALAHALGSVVTGALAGALGGVIGLSFTRPNAGAPGSRPPSWTADSRGAAGPPPPPPSSTSPPPPPSSTPPGFDPGI